MNKGVQKNRLSLGAVANLAVKPEPVSAGQLAIDRIFVKKQVRRALGDLAGLAQSIRDKGEIHTALLVHEEPDGRYRLIAGHRRLAAAPEAGLNKVPVKIYRDQSELQIRALQVSENMDRDELSAYDQAIGVIEDIASYGMEEARRIWNQSDKKKPGKSLQSESWMSKRVAVSRYAEPVLALLMNGACEDFEVLHSLNQLYGMAPREFDALAERCGGDNPPTRDETRAKVASVKEWLARQEPGGSPAELLGGQEAGGESEALEVDGEDGQAGTDAKPRAVSQKQKGPKKTGAASRADLARELANTRSAVIGSGERVGARFGDLMVGMQTLNLDLAEGEWVLWQSFVSTVGPVIAQLGKSRGRAYLERLGKQLRGNDSAASVDALLKELGADKDAPADMPKGWTF